MRTDTPAARAGMFRPVVLVTTGGLGDAILFSPVFRAAAAAFPEHPRLLVAANPLVPELYGQTPELSRVLLADTNRPASSAACRAFWSLYRFCRAAGGAELLVCATRLSRRQTAWFKTLCRPARVAARPNPPADHDDLAVNQALAAEIRPDAPPEPPFVPVTPEDLAGLETAMASMIRPDDLTRAVAIYPSTPRPNRPPWPLPLLADCAMRLARQLGGPILVVGGEHERRLWEQACGYRNGVVNLAGRLGLAQTAALFTRVRLALCNDGGLMHVAGAVNCPLVAILASVSTRYRPAGRFTRVVAPRNVPCSPCYPGTARCPRKSPDRPCIAAITPDQVHEAAEAALDAARAHPASS
jgi:heptosyltransferase-2